MVESQILREKPLFYDGDGLEMRDLFAPNVNDPSDGTFSFDIMIVDSETEFRPLYCAQVAYDTTEYWDLFLHVNGISNPFDIHKGDVLIVPELAYLRALDVSAPGTEADIMRSAMREINEDRSSRDDKERREYLEEKSDPAKSNNQNAKPRKPTQGDGSEGMEFGDNIVEVGRGLEDETDNLRRRVLKKALARAQEEGNTVLSKQIAKLLTC